VAPYGWRAPEGKPALQIITSGQMQEITIASKNDYMGEVQDLSEAIRGLRTPVYVAEPLEANMRVIDACYKAYRTGKAEAV
jgi:predicted dehydrogenase